MKRPFSPITFGFETSGLMDAYFGVSFTGFCGLVEGLSTTATPLLVVK